MRTKGFIAMAAMPWLLVAAPGALALPRISAAACFAGDAPPALGQDGARIAREFGLPPADLSPAAKD